MAVPSALLQLLLIYCPWNSSVNCPENRVGLCKAVFVSSQPCSQSAQLPFWELCISFPDLIHDSTVQYLLVAKDALHATAAIFCATGNALEIKVVFLPFVFYLSLPSGAMAGAVIGHLN